MQTLYELLWPGNPINEAIGRHLMARQRFLAPAPLRCAVLFIELSNHRLSLSVDGHLTKQKITCVSHE